MDHTHIRSQLDELRLLGAALIEQLISLDGEESAAFSAEELFNQFIERIDNDISRSEARAVKEYSASLVALKRFCEVLAPNPEIEALLQPHKAKAAAQIKKQTTDDIGGFAKPYKLFVELVDSQGKFEGDNESDLDLLDDFFGFKITRPLYQGRFACSAGQSNAPEAAEQTKPDSETAEEPLAPEESKADEEAVEGEANSVTVDAPCDDEIAKPTEQLETTEEPAPNAKAPDKSKAADEPTPDAGATEESVPDTETAEQLDKAEESTRRETSRVAGGFTISTEKETSKFSTKAFSSTYVMSSAKSNGKIVIDPFKVGDLALMHDFARLGALTRRQISESLYSDDITEDSLDRIIKNGLVSSARHEGSALEFLALSEKGGEVFSKENSRNVMNAVNPIPSTVWDCTSSLPFIESDAVAYKRTATTALNFLKTGHERVLSVETERVAINQQDSFIGVRIQYTGEKKDMELAILLYDDGEKTAVALPGTDWKILTGGFGSGSWSLETCKTIAYLYEVPDISDDFEFRLHDGVSVEIEVLLDELLQPEEEKAPEPDATVKEAETEADAPEEKPGTKEPLPLDTALKSGGPEDARESPPTTGIEVAESDEPALIAKKLLEAETLPTVREPFDMLVRSLLRKAAETENNNTDYLGRAVVLLKALSLADGPLYSEDYKCLLYATGLPLDPRGYTSENISALFNGKNEGTAMHIAALLRSLFNPDQEYDHPLFSYAEGILKDFDKIFGGFSALKPTLNAFLEIHKALPMGFTNKVTSSFVDAQTRNETLKQLSKEARELKATPRNIHQHVRGLPSMLAECFGDDSLLGLCMEIISSEKTEDRESVFEIYKGFVETEKISQERINAEIDEKWRRIRSNTRQTVQERIVSVARKKIVDAFNDRLDLIERWLNFTDSEKNADLPNLHLITTKIQKAIREAVEKTAEADDIAYADKAILGRILSNLLSKLDGKGSRGFILEDWLAGGILPLKSGIPILRSDFADIRHYESWRNALRHIENEPQGLAHVLERIDTQGDSLYDNLGQAIMICDYLKDGKKSEAYQGGIPHAEKAARDAIDAFESRLAIDYAYGRIDENVKEEVLDAFRGIESLFIETYNFSELRVFLEALTFTLQKEFARNRERLAAEIEERRKAKGANDYLDRAEAFLNEENANLILVEEALNNFDSDAMLDPDTPIPDEEELFEQFIAEDNYNRLEKVCRDYKNKKNAFRNWAPGYVKEWIEGKGFSQQYINSADRLLKGLPTSPRDNSGVGVQTVLEELGFNVTQVTRFDSGNTPMRFVATMKTDDKNRATYKHPVYKLGTQINEKFHIIVLFGSVEPASIISEVRKVNSPHIPIVFLDGSLTLVQRRQLAKLFFKAGEAANPFILVDWVLFLHLAKKIRDDRLMTMLACSLPYTGAHQLFSKSSTAPVSDEMYIGRTREMSKILDMNGPVIVYGGRQLGKTALLQRAKNLFHNEARNYYSIYIDVKNCDDEKTFAGLVCTELNEAGIKIPEADSIPGICDSLRTWFTKGDRRLLMLVDEADKLLSALAKVDNYAPLTPLENLCRVSEGKFKFVFAGLHNVFLAAKGANTIFGHFGDPLCIKPMSQADAYKLLARPLRYLGFSVNREMLYRLLVNTNYYPGVVHFVGAELIEMLMFDYAKYYDLAKNPPYELEDKHIGAINSKRLDMWIEERILWTLEVDPAYLSIARCIALLCYLEGEQSGRGYTPAKILDCAKEWDITNLAGVSEEECGILLSELCDMSILVETEGLFRFRQARFLRVIGKDEYEILEQLSTPEAPDAGV